MRTWKSRLKTRKNSKSFVVKNANYRLPCGLQHRYYSTDTKFLEEYIASENGWNDAINKTKFVVTT